MLNKAREAISVIMGKHTLPSVIDTPNGVGISGREPPRRGTEDTLLAYSKMPWLRAIVNKVGVAVGSTNWKLFVVKNSSKKAITRKDIAYGDTVYREAALKEMDEHGDLEEIVDHPLLDLLRKGNEDLLGRACFQVTAQYMDLVGEGFWVLETDLLGIPSSFFPIPPSWVADIPTRDNPFFTLQPSGRTIKIRKQDIIMFKDPDPANPYGRGTGIAGALGDDLEIDEYAAKHLRAFFFNRARPDVIISGDNIAKEDVDRLEHKWLKDHQGFMKAWKAIFFNKKIDIKTLVQSLEDLQMVQLRKAERDTIIQVYGVPPEKFGIVNESKRSTIDAADFFWTKDIITPRVEGLRNVLQHKLVPLYDDRLILGFASLVTEDKSFNLDAARRAPYALTVNEWRAFMDKPSLGPEGDVFIVEDKLRSVPDISDVPVASAEKKLRSILDGVAKVIDEWKNRS